MKIIEAKKTKIRGQDEEMLTYIDLVRVCVNAVKQGGFTVDEMRKRQRILDAVDKEKDGKMSLEDEDVKILKGCVAQMKWLTVHKDVIAFSDYIKDL